MFFVEESSAAAMASTTVSSASLASFRVIYAFTKDGRKLVPLVVEVASATAFVASDRLPLAVSNRRPAAVISVPDAVSLDMRDSMSVSILFRLASDRSSGAVSTAFL